MDSISLNCPACKKSLQFPPDKAGSKEECEHCGARCPIPQAAPPGGDDEDGGTYGLMEVIVEKKEIPVETKPEEKKALDPSL